jgi:4-amino-4-deoxy-L-arabinose transferase-like glycosyltransferase
LNENRLGSRAFCYWVIGLAALGTAISVLAAVYTRPPNLQLDENYYYPLAEKILAGAYPDGYIIRPPLCPLYLAAVFRIFGVGFLPVLMVSALVRGGLVAGVALLGRRLVSPAAGLAAGFVIAVYPMLVFTYTRFVSEIVYVPLFVLSFWFLEKAVASERPRDFAAAGALSGVASLARSTSLFFTVAVAAWLVARKSGTGRFSRRNFVSAALLVGIMLAVIFPWTARNAVVHKALILVDNSSAYNLWLMTSGKQVREATKEWESWGGQAERQREGYARWLEHLRSDPAFHFKRMATTIPKLFDPSGQPDAYALSMIMRGTIPRENPALRTTLKIAAPVVFWLLMAGGLVGLAILEKSAARRNLFILTVVYFVLLHATSLARPRFLLPLGAVLAPYAGGLIVYGGGLIAAGLSRWGLTRPGRRRPWSPEDSSRPGNPAPPPSR